MSGGGIIRGNKRDDDHRRTARGYETGKAHEKAERSLIAIRPCTGLVDTFFSPKKYFPQWFESAVVPEGAR